jgi:hypothetical protein
MIEVFGDGSAGRVGLWVQVPGGTVVPESVQKLAFIRSVIALRGPISVMELSLTTPGLFRQFYYCALAVAERILENRTPAVEAVALELASFAELTEQKALLGIERQLGLLGELVVLERLVRRLGPDSLNAWVGPKREPHDFRLQETEFEVKTTSRPQRVHTIHGTEQLVPTDGCSLFILSVLLAPAGAADGISLADSADALRSLLSSSPDLSREFDAALSHSGFNDADRAHYLRRYVLRRPLAVVPVDARLPALTRVSILAMFGSESTRFEEVDYDLNVEGLEIEDHKGGFATIFPA